MRILKEHSGTNTVEYAKAQCDLAWFYNDEGNYSVAEELGRHAVKVLQGHLGLAHADTLTALARSLLIPFCSINVTLVTSP